METQNQKCVLKFDLSNPKSQSRVKPSFAPECDINKIVARAKKNGHLPPPAGVPVFTDVSFIGDYQTVMNKIVSTNEAFMRLPAKVREKYGHDVANVLDALQTVTPETEDQLRADGILPPLTRAELRERQNAEVAKYEAAKAAAQAAAAGGTAGQSSGQNPPAK